MQLKQDLQATLMAKEQQEDVLRRRERELTAVRGALKEEVTSHGQEMDQLIEQHEEERRALKQNWAEATKVSGGQGSTEEMGGAGGRDARGCSFALVEVFWTGLVF